MATALFYYSLIPTLALLLLLTTPASSQVSSISASPSSLPTFPSPSSSLPPAMSPDLMPVFPSPKRGAASPPDGALPTIPSTPSPPNPDSFEPHSAAAPLGSEPVSAAVRGSFVNMFGWACGVVLMWWLEVGLVAIATAGLLV